VTLVQRVVVEPHDGSLGPLLRVADDRLAPGESYGAHDHRAVDVVALVVTGSLTHAWGEEAELRAGDVGVLRAGDGLRHDERAGPDGVRVLQCYLRPADPGAPAAHDVVRGATGWVELGRPDARLWLGTAEDDVPDGLVVEPEGSPVVVVWQLDAGRPAWAG
jgi:redox-sensitive bicupin YhaK (pirin superfamily)